MAAGTAVLAVDIGGTKMAAGVVDAAGALHHRTQRPTPIGGRDAVTRALLDLVAEVAAQAPGIDTIALACAGPMDAMTGTVTPVNIAAWRDEPVVDEVRVAQPDCEVALVNDAVAVAVAEAWVGAGRGARTLLGSVVSTGVGGGLVLDGRPYEGPTRNAGHVGHIVVEPDGDACPCGSRGCVETIASGPAMVRFARSQGWAPGGEADGRALAAAARAGDPPAVAAFGRGARALAAAFVSAAALVDLDRVVVGGGVAASGDTLFGPLRAAIADLAGMHYLRRLEVVPAELGTDAGLIGAARVAAAR